MAGLIPSKNSAFTPLIAEGHNPTPHPVANGLQAKKDPLVCKVTTVYKKQPSLKQIYEDSYQELLRCVPNEPISYTQVTELRKKITSISTQIVEDCEEILQKKLDKHSPDPSLTFPKNTFLDRYDLEAPLKLPESTERIRLKAEKRQDCERWWQDYRNVITPKSQFEWKARCVKLLQIKRRPFDRIFRRMASFLKEPLRCFQKETQPFPLLKEKCLTIPSMTTALMEKARTTSIKKLPFSLTKETIKGGSFSEIRTAKIGDVDCIVKTVKIVENAYLHQLVSETQLLLSLPKGFPGIVLPLGIYPQHLILPKLIPLQTVWKSKKPAELYHIAQGVANTLRLLHREGWVHKDVKIDNMLIDTQGNPYLCDFGFAHSIKVGYSDSGTPSCMPPELFKEKTGVKLTENEKKEFPIEKSDVFAFGIVLRSFLMNDWRPLMADFFSSSEQNYAAFIQSCGGALCLKYEHDMSTQTIRGRFGVHFQKLFDTAVLCLHGDPLQRPSMEEVYKKLTEESSFPTAAMEPETRTRKASQNPTIDPNTKKVKLETSDTIED